MTVYDIALVDRARHIVDIVRVDREGKLHTALVFQVFESESPRGRRQFGVEPREILVADVTADVCEDLVFVAHDRILIFPQDEGPVSHESRKNAEQSAVPQKDSIELDEDYPPPAVGCCEWVKVGLTDSLVCLHPTEIMVFRRGGK